jgi:hypothetical protein
MVPCTKGKAPYHLSYFYAFLQKGTETFCSKVKVESSHQKMELSSKAKTFQAPFANQ